MRDPNRISLILGGLGAVWQANPDWRLGQLMENIMLDPEQAWDDECYKHACMFHIEDDKAMELIRNALRPR